eukprot:Nk52_evm38s239 gene=Nk52_evmTU38s239
MAVEKAFLALVGALFISVATTTLMVVAIATEVWMYREVGANQEGINITGLFEHFDKVDEARYASIGVWEFVFHDIVEKDPVTNETTQIPNQSFYIHSDCEAGDTGFYLFDGNTQDCNEYMVSRAFSICAGGFGALAIVMMVAALASRKIALYPLLALIFSIMQIVCGMIAFFVFLALTKSATLTEATFDYGYSYYLFLGSWVLAFLSAAGTALAWRAVRGGDKLGSGKRGSDSTKSSRQRDGKGDSNVDAYRSTDMFLETKIKDPRGPIQQPPVGLLDDDSSVQ